ncbi:plasmid partitioning protein RepB [Rhizobium glycinendophyticum]|uniref:Plasmid partitioning protein RepB n=1 Tax=Rhizobium glycinendophyticum TaxID=2589807 RepID=A0A504TTD8_9HYPH|nr:plasmid partitioning protein RepB [Rhizobium glycinendophyticum]TPP04650.1 plasmid partitioning protein RepB [Rhizobium glycinendophyticum]
MTGRDRKNSIKALFGDAIAPTPASPPAPASQVPDVKSADVQPLPLKPSTPAASAPSDGAASPLRAASGAVKAMGLSLNTIAREAEEARHLRQALEEGERVLSLPTSRIEASFVSDRLTAGEVDDPQFAELVESMRESGQQVPILVRPHPSEDGRFQVAYGHRRLRAATALGIEVKALVRNLTDDQLVLAQGKENAERRNLSFIERAVFARTLVTRGFDRRLIGDALAVQKSELSRLLQVADGIPEAVIRAIGPAPKAGRERWMKLVELFGTKSAVDLSSDEIGRATFRAADTDRRFELLLARLARPTETSAAKVQPSELLAPGGRAFAGYKRQGRVVRIEFSKDVDEAFLDALSEHVREAYAAHLKANK